MVERQTRNLIFHSALFPEILLFGIWTLCLGAAHEGRVLLEALRFVAEPGQLIIIRLGDPPPPPFIALSHLPPPLRVGRVIGRLLQFPVLTTWSPHGLYQLRSCGGSITWPECCHGRTLHATNSIMSIGHPGTRVSHDVAGLGVCSNCGVFFGNTARFRYPSMDSLKGSAVAVRRRIVRQEHGV